MNAVDRAISIVDRQMMELASRTDREACRSRRGLEIIRSILLRQNPHSPQSQLICRSIS